MLDFVDKLENAKPDIKCFSRRSHETPADKMAKPDRITAIRWNRTELPRRRLRLQMKDLRKSCFVFILKF